MQPNIRLPTNLDQLRLARAIPPPVGNNTLVPMIQHDLPNVFGDATGAAGVDGGIDLEEFHTCLFQHILQSIRKSFNP
jgi:hypothetical protein